MKSILFLLRLFIFMLLLGGFFAIAEIVYDSIGIFGPVLFIGFLIAFLMMAFRK